MIKKIMPLALCCAMLFATSCATILTGSKQKVTFKSDLPGKVYQNLTEIGKTNEPIKINRRDLSKLYTVKTDGCADKQLELPLKTNGAYWIDIPLIFVGVGLIAAYIDVAFGNHVKTEKVINVTPDCQAKK